MAIGHWMNTSSSITIVIGVKTLHYASDLGVQALRWGVPWYRVEPQPGQFDWSWTDQVLPYLVNDLHVMPIVDLMHYGCPLWLDREFANPEYPSAVASYAEAFARRYHDLVSWYTPLNEPLINSVWCGRRGLWPPYLRGERGYVQMMMQLARGIVRTVHAIKGVDSRATMVHVEAAGLTRASVPELNVLAEEAQAQNFLSYELITGRITPGHPLYSWLVRNNASLHDLAELQRQAISLDVVGLNFYPQWSTVELYASRSGRMRPRAVEKDGAGFVELLTDAHQRYGASVMVTETSAYGLHATRSKWLKESIAAVKQLRGQGIPVIGYTWFPMTTMFEWRYRFGTRPADEYRVELGLYVLNHGEREDRWQATPLVAQFRENIANTEDAVGALALPTASGNTGMPAAQ